MPSWRDRRGLVDVEADAVAGAVLETVGPAGLGDDLARQTSSTSLALMPGRTAAAPAACEAPTTAKTRAMSPSGSAPTQKVRVMSER